MLTLCGVGVAPVWTSSIGDGYCVQVALHAELAGVGHQAAAAPDPVDPQHPP